MDPTFARLPTDACVYIQHTHSLDLRFLEDGEFVANGLLGFIKRLVHEVLEPHERADLTLEVFHRALQACQAARNAYHLPLNDRSGIVRGYFKGTR